jgi:hypothetical protein
MRAPVRLPRICRRAQRAALPAQIFLAAAAAATACQQPVALQWRLDMKKNKEDSTNKTENTKKTRPSSPHITS